MFKLSPSSLNLFLECAKCFWLQIVKKDKRPAGIFPSLPSGMDKVLKEHFDRFASIGKMPPELKLEGYKLFDDFEKLKKWRNNLSGISTEIEGAVLHGAVDNILVHNGKMVVLDYKTRGFPLKEDTAGHYQLQMDMYNYLLRKNGYDTEDYAYLLFYHPSHVKETGEVIFETSLVKMDIDVNHGEEILLKAIKVINEEMPEPSEECEWCKWRER